MDVQLSPRQTQVVRLAALGYTDKAIAMTLEISTRTVRNHLGMACERLGAVNRTNLVYLATAMGLIGQDAFTAN